MGLIKSANIDPDSDGIINIYSINERVKNKIGKDEIRKLELTINRVIETS